MKRSVIGTSYLGAAHAAVMAELGYEAVGVDTKASKVEARSRSTSPLTSPGRSS